MRIFLLNMKSKVERNAKDLITIGLINSIITNVRLLRDRDIEHASPEVLDALQDLTEMEELYFLLKANENAREIKNTRVNYLEDIENTRVMKTAISGMVSNIEQGAIKIPSEEKPTFEYENKLEWVPDDIPAGFYAYILMLSNGDKYKGHTGNFKARMLSHFNGFGGRTTKMYPPVYILHYEPFDTREQAKAREKWFKSPHGYSFIKDPSNFKSIKPNEQ